MEESKDVINLQTVEEGYKVSFRGKEVVLSPNLTAEQMRELLYNLVKNYKDEELKGE